MSLSLGGCLELISTKATSPHYLCPHQIVDPLGRAPGLGLEGSALFLGLEDASVLQRALGRAGRLMVTPAAGNGIRPFCAGVPGE